MKNIMLLFSFLIICESAFAQTSKDKEEKVKVKRFSKSIKLRQSFQSADSKPEPATFTYTKPKEGKESFLINAALGLSVVDTNLPNLNWSLFGEYHRNTLIDKAQNAIQGGLSFEWWTNKTFNINDEKKNSSTGIFNFNAKYSHNLIDTTHSLQITGELTPLFNRVNRPKALLPNANNSIGNIFDFQYFPAIGFENQYTFQAANDSAKGNVLRGVAKFYLGIKPFPKLLKSKLELYGDITERYDFINTTKYNDKNHPLLQVGLNIILFDKESKYAKIGASFNKGSNPAQGLKDQEYYLVSLKVKL